MPFLPCRHPFECGRWFDISWSKPLSTRRTRLFDRNRGESSPFHSSRHPDNLPLTFLPNFSSFTLSLFFLYFHFLESFSSFSSFPLFLFHVDSFVLAKYLDKFWKFSKYDQNLLRISFFFYFSLVVFSKFPPFSFAFHLVSILCTRKIWINDHSK